MKYFFSELCASVPLWFKRLRAFFRRSQLDAEMAEEMRAHIDAQTQRNLAAGMSEDDARAAAYRQFGGFAQIQERAREARGLRWLDDFRADVRYGVRMLARRPGLSTVIVLILGLGIGANTAVFSALEVLVFRTLPVPTAEELVVVTSVRTSGPDGSVSSVYLSGALFAALRDRASSLAGVLTLNGSGGSRALIASGAGLSEPVQVRTSDVSGSYFSVLQVTPRLGRLIAPEDDQEGDPRAVAVISHALWQRQCGGDPRVVGQTVLIEKTPFEIIGVAPEGFGGVKGGEPIEVWTPLSMLPTVNPRFGRNLSNTNWEGLFIIGRLRTGFTRAAATAEIDGLYQQLMLETRPNVADDERARVWGRIVLEPGASGVAGNVRTRGGPVLGILLVVVVLVQVIACANVASLSLARLASRQRELAARTAMGATRGRVVRQLLTEAMLLVVGAAVLGGGLVQWGFVAARAHGLEVQPNGWILLFGLGLLVATGLIVALVPALKSTRIDLATALKGQSSTLAGRGRSRLHQALVVVQLAVCGCLLTGTGYFVRTLQNLHDVDLGFEGESLLMVALETPTDYDAKRRGALVREVMQALKAAPGVSHVTYSVTGLLTGGTSQGPITVDGYGPQKNEDMTMRFVFIGPEFFAAVRLPLAQGRELTPDEVYAPTRGGTPKAVVNDAMVRRFFGATEPIGRHFQWGDDEYEIVGVAQNAKYRSLREDNLPICYVPWPVFGSPLVALQVRANGEPLALAASLPAILRQIDPNLRLRSTQTMADILSQATREERMTAIGIGAFSVLALLLTSLGLYGMLAYQVTQRTREIGVRTALGGRPGAIIRMILRQGLALTAVGWITGIVAAMGLIRLVASRLYGVSGADPIALLASAVLLAFVALLACWLPARRAAKVDPIVALRCE
jgi:macrolide transport system ATP-binding/permease protein